MDMFWGDRCGTVVDPDGYTWMVATHKAEPTSQEMKKKMMEQMRPAAGRCNCGLNGTCLMVIASNGLARTVCNHATRGVFVPKILYFCTSDVRIGRVSWLRSSLQEDG